LPTSSNFIEDFLGSNAQNQELSRVPKKIFNWDRKK